MKRLLLFDVDGTLMDAGGAGRAALRRAMLQVYGRTGPIDGYDFQGKTDPAIVRELLRSDGYTDAQVDDRLAPLWDYYCAGLDEELGARRERLQTFPGVRALLAHVRAESRFTPGLVTGNVEGGAWRKLRACRLDEPFPFGAFGSDSEDRNDLPGLAIQRAADVAGIEFEPEEVVVIGDTPADIRCARAAGTRALAVATGGFSGRQLASFEPDYLFDELTDLDEVIAAISA